MHMHGIARHFSVKHDMNQRKFFINQQRVKHCLWQKSQKFDHSFFRLQYPIFYGSMGWQILKEVMFKLSSKQNKWLNFTIFFFNVNNYFLVQHDRSFFTFFWITCSVLVVVIFSTTLAICWNRWTKTSTTLHNIVF